jgi:thioredoxin reductase (NADPH)
MIETAADRGAIGERWSDQRIAVVVLCAAWCDTCTEFRGKLERIASARPDMLFVWLDIEDDASVCGDIDVENFPTLAVYRGGALLHYGVSLPQEGTVARLVDEVGARGGATSDAPEAVLALPGALRAR